MAAYNAAQYISESIQSILDQTFTDFELLIVNDGSTDDTVAVVSTFKDERIRLLHNDRNRGLAYTRNVVMEAARGEYIAILDSDDIALPQRLNLQYEFFVQHPEFALCGGHGLFIDQNGDLMKDDRLRVVLGPENIKMTLLFTNTFVNSAVMFKTAVLRELGGYRDYGPVEDYELSVRISNHYKVSNIDEVFVKYRMHDSNTSGLKYETAKLKLEHLKQDQLKHLNIQDKDGHLAKVLFSILMCDHASYELSAYLELFIKLKAANLKLEHYPVAQFEKMLFDHWFRAIHEKKSKGSIALLFNKDLFKWSYVTARQLRKVIKLSLKNCFR